MKHLKTIMSVMILSAAVACTKNHADGSGQVSFDISGNFEVADQTRSNVSDYTTLPSAGDFVLSVSSASSAYSWSGKISEWDSSATLPAGNYKVTASYGSLDEEGFDKPFFTGSEDFAIIGGQITSVPVSVSLGNTVVLVRCTDTFKNYYKDYSFKLTRSGSTIATFAKGETKAAFVDGYRFTLEGTVQGPAKTQTFNKEYTSLNEATAYTFLFDVSNAGGATITVTFNDSVETISLGDVELND